MQLDKIQKTQTFDVFLNFFVKNQTVLVSVINFIDKFLRIAGFLTKLELIFENLRDKAHVEWKLCKKID